MSTNTITLVTGRTGGTLADNFEYRDRTDEIKVGDFLAETLVTDTILWEVTKITPKTVTLRATKATGTTIADDQCDKGGYGLGVAWEGQASNPNGVSRVFRVRKDGTIRAQANTPAFRPAPILEGQPCRRVDYRF